MPLKRVLPTSVAHTPLMEKFWCSEHCLMFFSFLPLGFLSSNKGLYTWEQKLELFLIRERSALNFKGLSPLSLPQACFHRIPAFLNSQAPHSRLTLSWPRQFSLTLTTNHLKRTMEAECLEVKKRLYVIAQSKWQNLGLCFLAPTSLGLLEIHWVLNGSGAEKTVEK